MLSHIYRSKECPRLEGMAKKQRFFPWMQKQMVAGSIVNLSSMKALPPKAARDLETIHEFGVKSNLTIPLSIGSEPPFGAFWLNTTQKLRHWTEEVVGQLRLVAEIFANALDRKKMDGQLMGRFQEILALKQRLESENIYLQKEIRYLSHRGTIVGQSLAMKRILADVERVAPTDSTVLILGETGTGKEMVAQAIHRMSRLKDRPMVTINCASIPPTLIESELFGREKGAYTGAMTRMIGRFEMADGSTLFLDEIGELPMDLQGKMLRVLEEGVFERLGSSKSIKVNVRIIAATNRDIEKEVERGGFRRDLFYRLNVFPISIPPLRQRPEDIPLLLWAFVKEFKQRMGKDIQTIPKKVLELLQAYSWPGNVRELRNVVERAMILSTDTTLVVQLPRQAAKEKSDLQNLNDIERKHILSVLERCGWRVGAAAEILGLKRSTLYSRMKKLKILRPSF
jgi:transcriptional regulator with GAF, ATPase, and Fis domain